MSPTSSFLVLQYELREVRNKPPHQLRVATPQSSSSSGSTRIKLLQDVTQESGHRILRHKDPYGSDIDEVVRIRKQD